ncbi:hypothetical protein GCM10027592_16120 [Spirosoma flavus]
MNFLTQPNAGQPADVPAGINNAILVLQITTDLVTTYQVIQANEAAQQLAGSVSLQGAWLEQLPYPFNSAEIASQLNRLDEQKSNTSFQLQPFDHPASGAAWYECHLVKASSGIVVLSLLWQKPNTDQLGSLEQVINAMPAGLIVFRAIRNSVGQIADFQAVLCNPVGAAITNQPRDYILTQPISERYPNMQAYDLFHRYVGVVTTGQPHQQLLYLPTRELWLDVSVAKYNDGLLVCFQDVTRGQKTTALLESVMSSSPASVRYYEAIRDSGGRIVDFMTSTGNELAAYRPFRPADSTVGKRMLELYPYLKHNGLFERYVAVVESGQPDQFETTHQLAARTIWFDCRAVRHGAGFVLTTLDITAQKEAQQAQQREAERLQLVLDHSLTGIAWLKSVFNTDGQLVDFILEKVNATLAQTLGYPAEALEGKSLSVLMPHQLVNGLFEKYATAAQTGVDQRFEWSNKAATIWYEIAAVAVPGGVIVTFMDISASRRAQLEGQRQADLVQGVLNSSVNSIVVMEPVVDEMGQVADFQIPLANPATMGLFSPFFDQAITQETINGQTLLTLFPAVKQRALFAALVSVVNTQVPIHTPVEYPELGLTYEYDIQPFRGGILMITTDITPLRVYQQKLEANNRALSRSNAYLQQFASVASHDLQEPLRKIEAFADLLLSHHAENLDETGQDLLRRQQNAARRMQILIRGLLDYSRLSTPSLPIEPVSLQTLFADVLSDLEATIQHTNAQVSSTPLPTLMGNAIQLRQLLQNLLANALKFTKPGQPPQVRVDSFPVSADQLPQPPSIVKPESWIAIRVADEGIGFDEASQERIFELFHRLHGRNQYSGTGIGLAIVKKVVENHGGQISVSSQPGAGAVFTIYLPAHA